MQKMLGMNRNQFGKKFWNLTVLSILVLTGLNVILMLKLLDGGCTRIYLERALLTNSQKSSQYEIKESLSAAPVFTFDPHLGRWDNRRLYKMFDHVLVGTRYKELSTKYTVCLATQSSIERIYSIIEVSHQWTGPISLALFAAGDEESGFLQGYIGFLLRCFPTMKERITFHLLFPKEKLPTTSTYVYETNSTMMDCKSPKFALDKLLNKMSRDVRDWRGNNLYPQNHLRNLARKNCQTPQVFLTDVDIIPSFNMTDELENFFATAECDGKCAYVIPTYELDNRTPFPKDKKELVQLSKRELARPFHQKVFRRNSYRTNFTRWEEDTTLGPVRVSHKVRFAFYYEPFYVADDIVPPHDERFIGYGLTKNTQVFEMHVAGYEFFVLTPIFTIHWGLHNYVRPWWTWRQRQGSENSKKLLQFKREILVRHGKRSLSREIMRNDDWPTTKNFENATNIFLGHYLHTIDCFITGNRLGCFCV